MSKALLKKHLLTLTKEQIIDQVLDLYDTGRPGKEYFEYWLNPDEKAQLEKYKAIIINEFYPKSRTATPKTRFSVAKKAIADFRALKPSPESLGDLMVTLPEMACQFTHDFGDMWEQYYSSAANNFKRALEYLYANNLLDHFKLRIEDCVKYARDCGYGFSDEITELYFEYYH
jgi:hypothetical protein